MPRFQYSSSPSMSGAYSSPVLRSAPTLRTPALRNTSKYLRDPRAGQRNMQLEVQAELDKAKPFQALVAGAGEIAETFLKADMKSKLTEAELNLRITTEGLLANMKSMPVGAASTTIDGKTGHQILIIVRFTKHHLQALPMSFLATEKSYPKHYLGQQKTNFSPVQLHMSHQLKLKLKRSIESSTLPICKAQFLVI